MPPLDWTVPFDDALVERWGHGCTLCARGPLAWVWARVVYGMTIGIGLCRPCRRQDPDHQQVDALLHQRYDPQRWG